MSVLIFESLPNELFFTLPVMFGAFGFLKKLFKKAKFVVGAGLTFIPGGGLIKAGVQVASKGLGAIVREAKGRSRRPQPKTETRFGVQEPVGFGFPQNKIFGMNKRD